LIFLFLLACLLLSTAANRTIAQDKAVDVLAEARGENYWICLVTEETSGTTKTYTSSVREQVDKAAGRWVEIARLQARVTDIAALDGRLAVLTTDGEIRLLASGYGTPGPRLPSSYAATRLAAAADGSLYAIGVPESSTTLPATTMPSATSPSATPPAASQPSSAFVLFRSVAGTQAWQQVALLPQGAWPMATLAIYDGDPWIAYFDENNRSTVQRFQNGQWQVTATMPTSIVVKLMTGPRPVLAARDVLGAYELFDLLGTPPRKTASIEARLPGDVVSVGQTLRSVSIEGDPPVLVQRGIDSAGNAFGPDPIAQIAAPGPAEHEQWLQFALLALMTLAMVLSLRTRPTLPPEVLAKSGLRIAPLSRRFAAGVIDAIPYIAVNLYLYPRVTSGEIDTFEVPRLVMLPVMIALAVYLLHTTIGELIDGRSIGKRIIGLRVVALDGTRATPGKILLRNLMRILDVNLLLPLLFVWLSPMRQRIGDLAAGTIVIENPKDAVQVKKSDV